MTRTPLTNTLPTLAAAAVLVLTTLTAPAAAAAAPSGNCLPVRMNQLRALQDRLDGLALDGLAGKSQYWYVDAARCTLTLAILRGTADPATSAFLDTARLVPALVEVVEVDAPIEPRVGLGPTPASPTTPAVDFHGGSTIYSGLTGTVFVCTAGFNGYRPDTTTTAGHCARDAPTWYDADGTAIGTVGTSRFPGADWAVVPKAAGVTLAPDIADGNAYTPITAFGQPRLDDRVCGTGATSGTQCGRIDATDVTVNYPNGAVTGLARSTQSGAAGDSGGPVHRNRTAVALISGGPRNGTPTFIQPLNF
ncbi:S1 family peptidase [Embleya sp. NBC_00896]|uniref:S1 family peptidase n=1 Tax=Embleya sp. NBC_00896 TaxID=2975961 RepID=UPI00386CB0DB|nr:S1 family peptidase [Embleya sp. NBC_00896]